MSYAVRLPTPTYEKFRRVMRKLGCWTWDELADVLVLTFLGDELGEGEARELREKSELMHKIEGAVLAAVREAVRDGGCGVYLKDLVRVVRSQVGPVSWWHVRKALRNLGLAKQYRRRRGGVFVYVRRERVEQSARRNNIKGDTLK